MSDPTHEPSASDRRLSEARFQAAIAAAGVMWTNDAQGRMKGVQPGWAALTGQSTESYQDHGWASAVHPDDAQPTIDAWNRAVANKQTFEIEHRVRRRDGQWRHFAVRAVPVVEDGRILEWVGVHIDITEQSKAIDELTASELRSQTILESITDGFFTLDREWRFDYVNPAAEKILNCRPGALLGQVIWAAYPGAVGSTFEHTYRRVADKRQPESFVAFYPDHGRWYEVRSFPLPAGLSVYFRDVTEAKQSETALRASEERRRLALDSAELGAWNIDPRRRVLLADERFWTIFTGLPTARKYEQTVAAVHQDDRERVVEAISAATRSEGADPYAIEYRVVHPDGQVRWVFAKGRANFDGPGRLLVSFDGTVADITARHRAEEEVRQVAAELSEANQRKDEFLATLAHELRNPLAPIGNGLHLIRLSNYALPTVQRTTAMMERQLRQMVRLVDDLLDVSRISRGTLQLQTSEVTLAAVLSQAVETSQHIVSSRGQEVIVSTPGEDLLLDADVTRLVQVFSNLINNAAKFSEPGSRIWLTVRTDSAREVTVTVRDEGVGIPADMLAKIFDMFVQVDRTLERSQGGLGIGLTLVRRLVELHGGSVHARSRVDSGGQGSEFVVRLPLLVSRHAEPTVQADVGGGSPQRTVLVADDNDDAAESLVQILRVMGHSVYQARNGLEALEIAAAFKPDVVILDIGMPKLNGYDVCRRMREQPWGRQAVVIALTGWGQDDDKRRSKEAGFDHHLVKPIKSDTLERLLLELAAS